MPIVEIENGDLLSAHADALVNPVNCVGVMGKGLALQFRRAFPNNYVEYKIACSCLQVFPGLMHVTATGRADGPKYIVNFPTKRHWRDSSHIEDIECGLLDLVKVVRRHSIESIAVPALGCGLGGLDWNAVRPMIEKAFSALPDMAVLLFGPIKK